jgi:hypothetical protein
LASAASALPVMPAKASATPWMRQGVHRQLAYACGDTGNRRANHSHRVSQNLADGNGSLFQALADTAQGVFSVPTGTVYILLEW